MALGVDSEDEAWEYMMQCERDGLGFAVKTSYGGRDTRFEQMDNAVEEDGVWIRLAIGFGDEEKDIIDTLRSLFESIQ